MKSQKWLKILMVWKLQLEIKTVDKNLQSKIHQELFSYSVKDIILKQEKQNTINKKQSKKKQRVQPEGSNQMSGKDISPSKSNYPLNQDPDLILQDQQDDGNNVSNIQQIPGKESQQEIESVKDGQSQQLLKLNHQQSEGTRKMIQKQNQLLNQAVKDQQYPLKKDAQELSKKRVLKNIKSVHRGYIARIKYKCLITLLSLLECSEDDASINNRIIRTFSWQVLLDNITDIYEIYKFRFQDKYQIEAFNKFENQIDPEKESDPLEDELIIENGFFLYILMVILLENSNKGQLDSQQLQTWEIIKENQTIQEESESNLLEESILGKVFKLIYDLVMKIIIYSAETSKKMALKAQEALLQNPEEREKQQKLMIQQYMKQRAQLKEESLKFFGSKTCHIEISRENKIQKIYFPKLPFCYLLPKEVKEQFHDECDYSNSKTKLSSFMDLTDDIIKVLEHEQHIQQLKKNFLVGMIADNKEIWEQLAFYTTWVINFVILFSYSQKNFDFSDGEYTESQLDSERRTNPKLFWNENNDWTIKLINTLGIFNLIFSGIVVSIFFLRKAPLLLKDMWVEWWTNQTTKFRKFLWFVFNVFRSMYICLNNFDFVYYMVYIVIIVLGLLVHPFFFGILTLDMLRSRTLKSVVQAIWYPIDTMGLTFLLFLIVTYWFSIFIYMYYYDNFEEGICDSLAVCFLRVFDYMFKEGGGVGSFMSEPALNDYFDEDLEIWIMQPLTEVDSNGNVIVTEIINYVYLGRFFFDFSILFILVILIINMVGGITIDTFKALKQQQQEIDELLNQFCFVCNIEREKLDKAYDVPNGFKQHIKSDHYLWNYLFYKAYILFKNETEYTGNETYVINYINMQDVSWFPIKKSIVIIDEENQESTEKLQAYDRIFNRMKNIKESITSLNVKSRNVMEVI
ncbi:hypothetical protein PPERSA_04075 [Pseudocohnilembus persalinus]|uniref:Ion transport domain-containing protein n=1 Tax=Pseudocohnilembus persalinus TaxID=266149 RepID=A0A0V0QLA8_PSEPJ|nr:hypothetical protein PPERSA_04075 [Pseudocohnilembus persalinus]|eukprot:KRX02872.1 hypothetical protein PPERSA_04075 [Pseudocohnilembus persalinus]